MSDGLLPPKLMLACKEFEAACEQGREALVARLRAERLETPLHEVVHEVLDGDRASITLFAIRENLAAERIRLAQTAFDYYLDIASEVGNYETPLAGMVSWIKTPSFYWHIRARHGALDGPVVYARTLYAGGELTLAEQIVRMADRVRVGYGLEGWAG